MRILLVEGAIGETISSALFNVGRNLAEEPCTRHALSRILRDEVLHARLFWEALTELRAGFDARELERLQREVTHALGVLPLERRVDAFYGALERRVRPALTRLGLDGDLAWDQRYRG